MVVAQDAKTHDIGSTKGLIVSVIKDQASDIEHGWREAVTNGIDSEGSSVVDLYWNESRSIITDDGAGVDLESDVDLLTDMGESSKVGDDGTIGTFGIGKGQYIAKGKVTILSNGSALHYNINEWGVDDGVRQTTIERAESFVGEFDSLWADRVAEGIEKHNGGVTIVVSHYEDEVPSRSYKWSRYADRFERRYRYAELALGKTVRMNGDVISDGDVADEISGKRTTVETIDDPDIGRYHIALGKDSVESFDVYSNGIFVKSLENSDGFSGAVVTEQNMDLNFARNDIKSGCDIWESVSQRLNKMKLNIGIRLSDTELTEPIRRFLIEESLDDEYVFESIKSKKLLRDCNGRYHSIDEVKSHGTVGIDSYSSDAADMLMEGMDSIVLDDSYASNTIFFEETDFEPTIDDVAEYARALDLMNNKRVLDESELSPSQKTKLGVARALAQNIGIRREIKYGESDLNNGWTDGRSTIVITDNAFTGGRYTQWIPELYRILIHEWCHNEDTSGEETPSHGDAFNNLYRTNIDDNWDQLTDIISEIEEVGVRHFRDIYA